VVGAAGVVIVVVATGPAVVVDGVLGAVVLVDGVPAGAVVGGWSLLRTWPEDCDGVEEFVVVLLAGLDREIVDRMPAGAAALAPAGVDPAAGCGVDARPTAVRGW
jgi:hypothetical protein